MFEIGDDLFDGIFHAIEVFESGVARNDAVGEEAAEARIGRGIDHFRLADGCQQTFGGGGVAGFILFAHVQKLLDAVLLLSGLLIPLLIVLEDAHNLALVIVACPEKEWITTFVLFTS